ncbi:MAG: LCP family protein [Acidimicrobiia bacterium]
MTRGQRWIIALLIVAVVLVGAVVGSLYLARFRMTDLGSIPSLAAGNDTYVLVGSDSRQNLPDDLEGKFGDFSGARADVIILMQVTDGVRQMISIPRDLKVDIPGHGTNKINAAYAFGGPDLLVETLTAETGVPINHYVEVGFGGLAGIVDAVGGIELDFPAPARDLKSGLQVDQAGSQVVDGATALAYARSRHYEEKRDGEWVPAGGNDIARTGRQREVLMKIVDKASSLSGVVRSPVLLTRVTGNLSVDSTVSPYRLVRTAWAFRSAGETQAVSLPVKTSSEGGVSYVVRQEPEATNMLEAFAAGRPLPGE